MGQSCRYASRMSSEMSAPRGTVQHPRSIWYAILKQEPKSWAQRAWAQGASIASASIASYEEKTMELSQIPQAWAERGFSCTGWTDPPGQVWANFVHEADELVTLV